MDNKDSGKRYIVSNIIYTEDKEELDIVSEQPIVVEEKKSIFKKFIEYIYRLIKR